MVNQHFDIITSSGSDIVIIYHDMCADFDEEFSAISRAYPSLHRLDGEKHRSALTQSHLFLSLSIDRRCQGCARLVKGLFHVQYDTFPPDKLHGFSFDFYISLKVCSSMSWTGHVSRNDK